MTVVVSSYEPVGDGHAIFEQHFSEIREVHRIWFGLMEELGAVALRPGHLGFPPSRLIFEGDPPKGFLPCGREGGKTEAKPHMATRLGKAAKAKLEALPRAPTADHLARSFGWDGSEAVVDGRSIYFPTTLTLALPEPRRFLRLPRRAGDGWTRPPTLADVAEGEVIRLIDAHNAAVRAARPAPKEAAPCP